MPQHPKAPDQNSGKAQAQTAAPRLKTGLNQAAHPPDELDKRARQILSALIHEHASSGGPVPSSQLAALPGIGLSSASVRSVLADLEALGYLDKPHTSAGRVPTDKGFRFYADVLVRFRPVGSKQRELIDQSYDPRRALLPSGQRIADTSRLLHHLTRYAGLASTPRNDEQIRALEFIQLREDRVLAVLVSQNGTVQNRLLQLEQPLGQKELDEASAFFADLLGEGKSLPELREQLQIELDSERLAYDQLAAQALRLGAQLLESSDPQLPQIVLMGETALATEPTLSESVEQLRGLFRALKHKTRLNNLLFRAQEAGELTLFIGEETGLSSGASLSVVASPYSRAGEILGSIGVIGPSSMLYSRIIPLVEYTAQALSKSLDET